MTSFYPKGPRLIIGPRQSQIITQRMIASQKLLMAPALSTSTERTITPPTPANPDTGARLVREVARVIKSEDRLTPLSDREILSRVRLKLNDASLSTQSVARARFKLGLPPSARRHR